LLNRKKPVMFTGFFLTLPDRKPVI